MGTYELSCSRCGAAISATVFHRVCAACGGDLAFRYDLSDVCLDCDPPSSAVGVLTGSGRRGTHVHGERRFVGGAVA